MTKAISIPSRRMDETARSPECRGAGRNYSSVQSSGATFRLRSRAARCILHNTLSFGETFAVEQMYVGLFHHRADRLREGFSSDCLESQSAFRLRIGG
jgi:hypothetical protein